MNNMINTIKEKLAEIDNLNKQINNINIDDLDIDLSNEYDEMLNAQGMLTIGCIEFYPSRVLKELDPIAYQCGYNDFISGIDISSYSEYDDKISEITEQIENIKESIIDLINAY